MTWWIGRAWKASNRCSEAVLRAEGASLAPSFGRATRRISCSSTGYVLGMLGQSHGGGAVCGVVPPVPFPNTVVKRLSADDTGGVASGTIGRCRPLRRGVEQWQLVGLITRRSPVRIRPPLPTRNPRYQLDTSGFLLLCASAQSQ
jgi:hypothetical protein